MSEDTTWPVKVNDHLVRKTSPKFGAAPAIEEIPLESDPLELDKTTVFKCQRCDHTIRPPKNRIEDEQWVQNAFSNVDCDPE